LGYSHCQLAISHGLVGILTAYAVLTQFLKQLYTKKFHSWL